jgi:hypothetical protein
LNNFVNIEFHDLKICANCSAPFKIVIHKLTESQNDFEISVISQKNSKSLFPHLELFKPDFDLENIKQSWLSGQNIGLHAPSPWFKPQQPLPKKKR